MDLIDLYLAEALSTPYEYTITSDRGHERIASFQSGDREIEVSIENQTDDRWEIVFAERRLRPNKTSKTLSFNVTGSGDEFRVFATVMKIAKDFIEQRGREVKELMFTSEKDERSRTRLYHRLIQRFSIPGWEQIADSNASEYRTYFIFKRKTNA